MIGFCRDESCRKLRYHYLRTSGFVDGVLCHSHDVGISGLRLQDYDSAKARCLPRNHRLYQPQYVVLAMTLI